MTKKDYILIADAIKENILYKPNDPSYKAIDVDFSGLVSSISRVLKADNNRFDIDKFKHYIND